MVGMTVRDRRAARATSLADALAENARREFRQGRTAARLSRGDIGRAMAISPSQVDRFERGMLRDIRLGPLCLMMAAVG
jgi:hypothetical protein